MKNIHGNQKRVFFSNPPNSKINDTLNANADAQSTIALNRLCDVCARSMVGKSTVLRKNTISK